MAVTATPVFTQTPNVGALNAVLSTAMTNTKAFDGTEATGTAMVLAFTAGSDGARIDQIVCRLASTNGTTASGTSAATLVRFWINNGSANTTAGNNIFLGEVAIPATTVTALGTSALTTYPLTLPVNGLNLPASYRIYAGTTVAAGGTNIGIAVSAIGGNY
jgi:uncharacterized membrane protein YadS